MQTRKSDVTNAQYAKGNEKFRTACEKAGVEPTKRQASKFRRGIGRAAQHVHSELEAIDNG